MKARVTGSKLENNQVFQLFQLEEEAVELGDGHNPGIRCAFQDGSSQQWPSVGVRDAP